MGKAVKIKTACSLIELALSCHVLSAHVFCLMFGQLRSIFFNVLPRVFLSKVIV